jgi:L-asparaginase II
MSVPLTRVLRGGHLESVHRGSIAIVDSRGRLIAYAGDPGLVTCIRSAAKPFQAIPLLEYGGVEEFDLTGEEIALTAASHGGETIHVATAAAMLRKGEMDEEDLLCGAHMPYDEKAQADLRASGESPSPLHNNCSGKHAGMLLATRVMDIASATYTDPDHPLQQAVLETIAGFAGVAADEIPIAIDGCGVPAFFLSLHRTAWAYARLMAANEDGSTDPAVARYAGSASHVVEAMTAFPQYVAGNWSLTTPLITSFAGDLVAKDGAEGFYAMALSPALAGELTERFDVADDVALGIAIKIDDGSMERGRYPAIIHLLELLGLDPRARPELSPWLERPLFNHSGTRVGEVRAEFDLEVL